MAKDERLRLVEIDFCACVESEWGGATCVFKELFCLAVELAVGCPCLRDEWSGVAGDTVDGAGGDADVVIHPMRLAK